MGYAEILSNQIPDFISGTKLFSNVQLVQGTELDKLGIAINDLELQLSPLTATWSLPYWESVFGIPVNINDDINLRRGRILAKTTNISPLTPTALKTILSNFATDIDVQSVPGEYRFIVTFNVTNNLNAVVDNIKNTVDEVKPAHLVYDLAFGFISNIQIDTSYEQYNHDCYYCGEILSGQYYL